MALAIESCSAQHIGDRDEQQDRVALIPHGKHLGTMLLVLADGMGGLTGGALAAEQVVLAARQAFEHFSPANAPEEVLASCINDSHEGMKLAAISSGLEPHSTACVLILQPGRADWAHCGDSRIYHFRNGELMARSVDHSVVMRRMVLPGHLTEAQAGRHPKKNLLSSCLGHVTPPEIEFGKADNLQIGDCFMACSDGIWAYFQDDELGEILASLPPRQAAESLIGLARERARGQGDNCAVAIIKVVAAAPKKTGPMGTPMVKPN